MSQSNTLITPNIAACFVKNVARPPLGLPNGSVRAILTLLVVAVVIFQAVHNKEIEPLWTETLMIVLAHYFTSRRFINFEPAVLKELEAEGHIESESNPLYLPKHSISALIVMAFSGLAIYAYYAGHLLDVQVVAVLGIVFAYIFGVVMRAFTGWWNKGRKSESKTMRSWNDIKAASVMLVLGVTSIAYLLDHSDLVPHHLRNMTLGLVLFYFGSR